MDITATQLASHLQRGLKSLYILHGDDPLLQQEAADAIRAAGRAQGYSERTVFTVTGAHFDWSAILAAGGALSLFADKQLLEIRVPSGKPGKEGSATLQHMAASSADQDSNLTLVFLPRLDAASKKSPWFTALESHGVMVKIDPIERTQLPTWIAQRLQQQGQRVATGEEGQRTLTFIADRVEGNLLAAHQEIQKLALLYPVGELTLAQIERAVLNVARYDPFKLAEAVLDGHPLRVQRMLDGLAAEGEAAVLVHWALAEDIRALYRAKRALAEGKPLPMVLREQRIWGAKEKRFERLLPRLNNTDLGLWLQAAHVVDGIVKGLKNPDWPTDPWQALHRLAIMVCQGCKTG
jgi:DNA polymerase III subunit delta